MFLSDTHLPQTLSPAQYRDQSYFDREIDHAFLPAWHMVGCTADFPHDGDFVMMPLLGREIIIWRCGTQFHCFLNVCPHRFCALTDEASGRSPEKLRCQYHAWEFDGTGATRKIPDAPSFRPMSKGAAGLMRFPLEQVGPLLFVSLAPNPVPLKSFLGPTHDLILDRFSGEWTLGWSYAPECAGNWKEAVEVTLEGYHVVGAHEKSLGKYPLVAEERCVHEFPDDKHCCFRADHSDDPHSVYRMQRLIARACGWAPNLTWYHYHAYPHFGIVSSNSHALAQCVIPIAPNKHVNLHRFFIRKSVRRNPVARIAARIINQSMLQLARDTVAEDLKVIEAHHRGLSAPVVPQGGLISRREERVVHFQKYVDRIHRGVSAVGGESPARNDPGECPTIDASSAGSASNGACGTHCRDSFCGTAG